jgi:beta-glucosidase
VLVAGDGADDIGRQSGGWTLTWQGTGNSNEDFPGATSIFEGIRATVAAAGGTATLSVDGRFQSRPDVAIVVFGETPYAEWHGDVRSLDYEGGTRRGIEIDMSRPAPETSTLGGREERTSAPPAPASSAAAGERNPDLALLLRLRRSHIPLVSVFLTGRPRVITPEVQASDAFVVAWLPGSEGGGIADVLFRKSTGKVNFDFTGRLSFSWPRGAQQAGGDRGDRRAGEQRGDRDESALFPNGFGLTYCIRHCDAPSSWQP